MSLTKEWRPDRSRSDRCKPVAFPRIRATGTPLAKAPQGKGGSLKLTGREGNEVVLGAFRRGLQPGKNSDRAPELEGTRFASRAVAKNLSERNQGAK